MDDNVGARLGKMQGNMAFASVGNENGIKWHFDSSVLSQNLMAKYRSKKLELRFETGIYSDPESPELGFRTRGGYRVHEYYWTEESRKRVRAELEKFGIRDGQPIPSA